LHIESIQDEVELVLMRSGEHEVARRYVLYREARTKERALLVAEQQGITPELQMKLPDGRLVAIDYVRLRTIIEESSAGLGDQVSKPVCSIQKSLSSTWRNWVPPSSPIEIFNSNTLDCRPSTIVTSCTRRDVASNCRRHSGCVSPWGCRSMKLIAKPEPSSSTS